MRILVLLFFTLTQLLPLISQDWNQNAIQPYKQNPRYWQYKGEPVMLIGGSKDDNLFQIPGLKEHLDLMQHVGANYIRNTMSSRDEGNVQPFETKNGKFDLSKWNDAYWNRFENMLQMTSERDIIVQIEIWAFHDFTGDDWVVSPWNPKNNSNYTAQETVLKTEGYGNYWRTLHDFFTTVPALKNDQTVIKHQQQFVDKILSISLNYPNVLYCMTNEIFTQYSPEWGWYWAKYIKNKAAENDKTIQVAEMFQNHDLTHQQHRATLDHPEIYDFIDISQNSRQHDDTHWNRLQWVREYIEKNPRPINHTKTYGGERGIWTDGPGHGIERWWRNIIGGAASTRFHRPPSGIGLNERAQRHVRSARMILEEVDIFSGQPDEGHELLFARGSDEAYLNYKKGEYYVIYFPDGGDVQLDLREENGMFEIKYLSIEGSTWHKASWTLDEVKGGLFAPIWIEHKGNWAVVLKKK